MNPPKPCTLDVDIINISSSSPGAVSPSGSHSPTQTRLPSTTQTTKPLHQQLTASLADLNIAGKTFKLNGRNYITLFL